MQMKYFIPIISLFLFVNCATKPNSSILEILIHPTSKVIVGSDYKMKISKIVSDSRCPEGLNCVWAGEVQLELKVYKNQKLEKSEILSINYKNLELNKQFFTHYLKSDKKIKDILISPSKKEEQNIEFKNYVLKIVLE